MHRGLCWVVAVALLVGGCARKGVLPETESAEAQPQADQPADSNTPVLSAAAHPIVSVTREFLTAVAVGNFRQALALSVPGEITEQGLAGMREAFALDLTTFTQAWVGAEQATVFTDFLPARQGSARAAWAINLIVTQDGRWLVRLSDILFSQEMIEDYLAAFHEVAPHAEAIEL
jgi:hypothetical protein